MWVSSVAEEVSLKGYLFLGAFLSGILSSDIWQEHFLTDS
jgi:hypothetical protein